MERTADPAHSPLLRIPPFPGVKPVSMTRHADLSAAMTDDEALRIIAALREHRVGGTYWARQPILPPGEHLVLHPNDDAMAAEMLAQAKIHVDDGPSLLWLTEASSSTIQPDMRVVCGDCDPWHMLEGASEFWAGADDENALIAALLGVPLRLFGQGRFAALAQADHRALPDIIRRELGTAILWFDPFTGALTSLEAIVGHCAAWRKLIDANRPVTAAFGFGHWKQGTVDALLWNGSTMRTPFLPAQKERLDALPEDAGIALWKARVPADFLKKCESGQRPLFEVEDGFIRSVGLGADCVPPLSIIVDPVGVHYDPSSPSSLETLLSEGDFAPDQLARAAILRELIVESGISKYSVGGKPLSRPGGARRHILVPGQVEDDRSVLAGGGNIRSNLDLLRRVRAAEPDAYILYKPHPDILSGHRKGHVPEADALRHADSIVTDSGISALLDMVDGVHVLTSLAGFEALLRGKDVTTHGVPFYAGWGLTRDLDTIPSRRGRKRSLDELVAATLLLYPRYLDPVTGLPCPPEILIERLKAGTRRENRAIVMLRRTHGNLRRLISGLGLAP